MACTQALPSQRVVLCYDRRMQGAATTHFAVAKTCAATSHFAGGLQTVALYDLEISGRDALPVEVRSWRATHSISEEALRGLLEDWEPSRPPHYEYGISSEEVRGIPIGHIHRTMHSRLRRDTLQEDLDLVLPTSEQIESIIKAGLIPDLWRNSRDLRAHARELQGAVAYLKAVYSDESVQPMRAVADKVGMEIPAARKLIEQARSHGYLTRADGTVGGYITENARTAANLLILAAREAGAKS